MNQPDGGTCGVRRFPLYVGLLVLVLAAGCAAQTSMTDLWKDPTYTAGPLKNALIVALRKEPVRRRLWEDAFAKELASRGVIATPSYQLFPSAAPDTQDVIAAVRKNGYGAVVVSVRLPNETTTTYVPGALRRESVTMQDYFGGFHSYWRDVQDPGHTEVDEIRRVQTDIWATGGQGRLVWSGTVEMLDSASQPTMESAVSDDIVPLMARDGLVPGKK